VKQVKTGQARRMHFSSTWSRLWSH
jgi:hypothetical protein